MDGTVLGNDMDKPVQWRNDSERKMYARPYLPIGIVVGMAVCWPAVLWANEPNASASSAVAPEAVAAVEAATETQPLFSPSVAGRFYDLAQELAGPSDAPQAQLIRALILLDAAAQLDSAAGYVRPLQIEIASRVTARDYTQEVNRWLAEYTGPTADLDIVRRGITYLLESANAREDREKLLARLAKELGPKNRVLDSEFLCLLANLAAEKPDLETAKNLLAAAYKANRHNRLAFTRLSDLSPDKISPPAYLEHLRLVLREDPTDIDAAVGFAQYAEQLMLYETATESYRYCARLFTYLYPTDRLPVHIYLPWAVSAYNTERGQTLCLQIANAIRQGGRFDLLLEAIAGRAAARMGNQEEAQRILRAAAARAEELLKAGPAAISGDDSVAGVGAKQLAWFYCFASPDSTKALDWANKAYTTEPNSPAAASILAYALVLKDQHEWAQPLIEAAPDNQIAGLVRAKIQIKEGNASQAVQTLKTAIARDPSSPAAEEALALLKAQGIEYIPPVDPDVLRTIMTETFGDAFIPRFTKPENAIGLQFNVRGNKFTYGGGFGATVAVVNNTAEPMIVSDHGLFKGNIRIDAAVTGDLNRKMPALVVRRVRTTPEIAPGQSMLIPVQLVAGELRGLLLDHPQASLTIEFTLYIDPVVGDEGKVTNRLVNLPPAKVTISRPGIELTGQYLRNRFNSISTGQAGQKIITAQLFIGLLKEQQIMSNRTPLYRFRYADWMPPLLESALLHESGLLRHPGNGEWVVKAHTLTDMIGLPLNQEITTAVAESINNVAWPVRMMALYLLSHQGNPRFSSVLEWAAQHDASPCVRDMATALQMPAAPGK